MHSLGLGELFFEAGDNGGEMRLFALFVSAGSLQSQSLADDGVEVGHHKAFIVGALGATLGMLASGGGEEVTDLHL